MPSEEPFYDRLMMKNFKVYQKKQEERIKFQDYSMQNYKRALLSSKSIEALQQLDEMNAHKSTSDLQDRQQHYDSILVKKKEKSKEEQLKWFEMHERAK